MNTVDYSTTSIHKENIIKIDQPDSLRQEINSSRARRLNLGDLGNQNQRVNSNYRNESLERILGGDKAHNLFNQLEKIQSKEYLKLNRSILTIHDRGDSSNRQVTSTPILLVQSTNSAEDSKKPVQRKRQMTFTTGNSAP